MAVVVGVDLAVVGEINGVVNVVGEIVEGVVVAWVVCVGSERGVRSRLVRGREGRQGQERVLRGVGMEECICVLLLLLLLWVVGREECVSVVGVVGVCVCVCVSVLLQL